MKSLQPRLRAAIVVSLVLVAGAGSARAQASDSTPADAARRAAGMRVQPGDRIAVHVLRELELSDTVTVTDRGEAAFAKLGVMRVDQYTIRELQDTLRAQYARYLRNPALDIVVLRRVAVNGEVKNPDVYLVDVSTTLRDAVARAGGITPEGNSRKLFIVRDGVRLPVANWEHESGSAADLRSGDQVFVPRKSWIVLNSLSVASTALILVSVALSVAK